MTDLPPSPFGVRPFVTRLLEAAAKEVGTRETTRNGGPRVDEYLASVGLGTGYPWCAAFVVWCHSQARRAGGKLPCPKTAGALRLWDLSAPFARRGQPAPGYVFVLDHGHGLGHVGIVESVREDGVLVSIEGNTNAEGSREGDRVARKTWDPQNGSRGELRGYLDFTEDA